MHVDTINYSVTLIYMWYVVEVVLQKHDSIEQVLVIFFNWIREYIFMFILNQFFQLIWPNDRHRSDFKGHLSHKTFLQLFL